MFSSCVQRGPPEPEAESSPLSSVEQLYSSILSPQSPREDEVRKAPGEVEMQNSSAEHTEPTELPEGNRENKGSSWSDVMPHLGNQTYKMTLTGTEAMGRNRSAT